MFLITSNYSPKNLLATYLAQSLATLFVNINSHQIQSNLIQDAHVVLNNVEIKPRYFYDNDSGAADCCSGKADDFTSAGIREPCRERKANSTQHIKVYGNIDEIEFTWVWDTSSSSFIKDVQLIIRGVHVHVLIDASPSNHESDISSNFDNNNNETYENSERENDPATLRSTSVDDWKSKYLQQILDHLTLIVTDATISIHITTSGSVGNSYRRGRGRASKEEE